MTLWKLDIPLKTKNFVWKVCFDWIPTLSNLARRRVQVVDRCPICNNLGETTFHALWGCRKFKNVRKGWLPPDVQVSSQIFGFFDLILVCYTELKKEELELFCTIVWRVWFLRNLVVHGSPKQDFF